MNNDKKKHQNKDRKEKVAKVIDKYIVEKKKKKQVKKKYNKISNLVEQTEKEIQNTVENKVKLLESVEKRKEKKIMIKGDNEYTSFTSNLLSAKPRTEEELKQDIEDLQDAVSTLESIDINMIPSIKKKIEIGLGIFYDKIARRLQKIIKQNHLDDFKFIPIQRLKYYVVNQIPNLKNDDFLPILNVMVETDLIQGLIEINPTLSFILFIKEDLELSESQKVALSFAYDEDILTIEKLLELTQWSEEYAIKTLKALLKKNLLGIVDNVIKVESFEPLKERKKWNNIIEESLKREKEIKEKKFQKSLEKRKDLEKQLENLKKKKQENEIIEKEFETKPSQIEKVKDLKFGNKPKIKQLPKQEFISKSDNELNENELQDLKDKDSLIEAMDELDKEMQNSHSDRDGVINKRKLNFSLEDNNIDRESDNFEEKISEVILNFDEKYSMMNAGFVQYEKIRDFIIKNTENINEKKIKNEIAHLLKLKLIQNSVTINNINFYMFKELKLNSKEKTFISKLVNKPPLNKDKIKDILKWDKNLTLKIIISLQEKGILRLEKDKIIIPGIVQNEMNDDFLIL